MADVTPDEKRWIRRMKRCMKDMPDTLRLVVGYGWRGPGVIHACNGEEAFHPDARLDNCPASGFTPILLDWD
jgi:hypothetical protein